MKDSSARYVYHMAKNMQWKYRKSMKKKDVNDGRQEGISMRLIRIIARKEWGDYTISGYYNVANARGAGSNEQRSEKIRIFQDGGCLTLGASGLRRYRSSQKEDKGYCIAGVGLMIEKL